MKALPRISVIAAATITSLSASVGARQTGTSAELAGFGGIKAPVRASRDATLSFTFPAEVSKVVVKGGQRVKQGELLIQSRDDEARAQCELQKSQADSDLDVQKAQTGVDQAQVEFDAQKIMKERKAVGSEIEFERARTVLAARKVELEIAKLQRVQAVIQLKLRQAQLDRFAITAPFSGIVDNVMVEVGEVKKDTEPVLKLVSTDLLWMDVSTPTEQTITLGLKPGDKAWVVLELPGEPAVYLGKVIEVAAEADFTARALRVRVELANASDWPAGIQAWVRFTPPGGEWAKRIVAPKRADAGLPKVATEQTKK